jgi:transcriptional regulator with XRE-family HTH domain
MSKVFYNFRNYTGLSYKQVMTRGERIKMAMKVARMKQPKLAKLIGVSQVYVSRIVNDRDPADARLPQIAEVLGVPFEWLAVGGHPPSWAEPAPAERSGTTTYDSPPTLTVEGQVSAGAGDIDLWADVGGRLRFGKEWAAVRVQGDSAYPVVYPDQYALVDYARAVTLDNLDERAGWDLDDDVVLVRLHNGGALLKRFCFHPPGDFILASVNGGRRSPLVRREDIHCIVPVVGTIYHGADERPVERWKDKKAMRGKR